jgi:hypothetical protein
VKRLALMLAMAAIITALGVGIGSADPVNSKNVQRFHLDCGGEQITVVTIFQNKALVANIEGSTGNFVITRLSGTFTYTDPQTGEEVTESFDEPISNGPQVGLQEDLISCTTPRIAEDPELGTLFVDLTLTGFLTPRGG